MERTTIKELNELVDQLGKKLGMRLMAFPSTTRKGWTVKVMEGATGYDTKGTLVFLEGTIGQCYLQLSKGMKIVEAIAQFNEGGKS